MAKEEPAMARPIDRDKERFWRDVLARWTASGFSIAAFCEKAGLSEESFYRWRRVLRERTGRPGRPRCARSAPGARAQARDTSARAAAARSAPVFVPVTVDALPAAPVLEVVSGGRVVRVPVGFDAPTLAQVLRVLEDQPC
jgi:hypothetical protein